MRRYSNATCDQDSWEKSNHGRGQFLIWHKTHRVKAKPTRKEHSKMTHLNNILFVLFLIVVFSPVADAKEWTSARDRLYEKGETGGADASTSGVGYGTTKEEFLDNRARRRSQIDVMVRTLRKQLADHSAGERLLEEDEKKATDRRIDLYQRKLDELAKPMKDTVSVTISILVLLMQSDVVPFSRCM
jgi:hypothetical protein